MKRDRLAEIEKGLIEAEASLRSMLLETLTQDPDAGASLLVNSAHLPVGYPRSRLTARGESLYQHACTCLRLREQLRLPAQGSVGALFVAACAENASEGENRLGPRRLAKSLVERLADET